MLDTDNKTKMLERTMANCYGTENYYVARHLAFKYTDGVKTFCETAAAYWLLDLVNSIVITKPSMNNDLIVITLIVNDNHRATITFEDSEKVIHKQDIPYTDCPSGEWKFFYDNNVFFWNGEY